MVPYNNLGLICLGTRRAIRPKAENNAKEKAKSARESRKGQIGGSIEHKGS